MKVQRSTLKDRGEVPGDPAKGAGDRLEVIQY
jgi:hypothetical protein